MTSQSDDPEFVERLHGSAATIGYAVGLDEQSRWYAGFQKKVQVQSLDEFIKPFIEAEPWQG
jgi:hypothetical protein